MFVCTIRKGGVRRLVAAALCGVVLAGAAFAANTIHGKAVEAAAGGPLTQQITGAADVASFLQGFGLTVDPTTAEVSTVTVPRKWDENFKAFNEVIKDCGLDLTRVKNKKVDKWVVLIPDKSTAEQKCYGVVLVYKNEPKGAYILQKPSGEVLSLKQAASMPTSLALTDEEIAANAGFGEGDGTVPADTPVEAPAADVPQDTVPADAPVEDTPVQADAGEIAIDPNGFPTD